MGHSISVKCNNCSYISSFRLGIGMAYGDLERVLGWDTLKDKKMTNEILQILRHNAVS